jgi:hypothetical protein
LNTENLESALQVLFLLYFQVKIITGNPVVTLIIIQIFFSFLTNFKTSVVELCFTYLLKNFAMSAVTFELDNLSPEVLRHEQDFDSELTLTCLTELSSDSSQLELQHSISDPTGKLTFRWICLGILTYI